MMTAEQVRAAWSPEVRERYTAFMNFVWHLDQVDGWAADKIRYPHPYEANEEVRFILGTTTIAEDDPTKLAYNRPDAPERRVKLSWVKWLKKLAHLGYPILPEEKYQQLMTLVEIHLLPPKPPKFIPNEGDAINKIYKHGPSSCMKGEPRLTAWYQENPDTVLGMLVIQHGEVYSARALVFKTIDGDTVLGRVYTSAPAELGAMLEYAQNQGWDVPNDPTSHASDYRSGKIHIIKMGYSRSGEYPYVDIFQYGIAGDGYELWSSSGALYSALDFGDEAVEFTYTDGQALTVVKRNGGWAAQPEGDIEVTAGSHTGEFHPPEDVVEIGTDCYHQDDVVWDNNGTPIPRDRAVWMDSIGGYVWDDDTVQDWRGNTILREGACVIARGEYEGEYAPPQDVARDVNGDDILECEAVYIDRRCYHMDDVVTDWKGEYIPLEYAAKLTFGPITGEFAHQDECIQVDGDWALRLGELDRWVWESWASANPVNLAAYVS